MKAVVKAMGVAVVCLGVQESWGKGDQTGEQKIHDWIHAKRTKAEGNITKCASPSLARS